MEAQLPLSLILLLNFVSPSLLLNNDYKSLESDVSELQTNFQDGVNSIYEALISAGLTPSSTDLADIVTAIESGSSTTSSSVTTAIMVASFQVSTANSDTVDISDYIENYSELTVDNFLVTVVSYPKATFDLANSADVQFTAINPSQTYDAETGILTVSGYRGRAYQHSTAYCYSFPTLKVWLVPISASDTTSEEN